MKKIFMIIVSAALACGIGLAAVGCGGNAAKDASGEIIVVSREEGSGTRGAFVELTGVEAKDEQGNKVDRTIKTALMTNSTNMVLTTVSGAAGAIGYVSMGSLNENVTAVSVDGVAATTENVLSGDYKLARPFNVAYKNGATETNDLLKDFLSFIDSNDGQQIVKEKGYIPKDGTGAYSAPASLTTKSITVGGSSSISPLMEKLIEAYKGKNSGVTIKLQTSDSSAGMSGVADGSFELGMASRAVKESEIEKGITPVQIATDGIAVIVNNGNSTKAFTMKQICDIYIGEITTWEQLRGDKAE